MKYKLIKEYPGSKELGTVVDSKEKLDNLYPEYWEKVKTKRTKQVIIEVEENQEIKFGFEAKVDNTTVKGVVLEEKKKVVEKYIKKDCQKCLFSNRFIEQLPCNCCKNLTRFETTGTDNFQSKTDLSNTKIEIGDNPKLSELVQKKAFELGWSWVGEKKILHLDVPYLYFWKDIYICYGKSSSAFHNDPYIQIFPSDLGIKEEDYTVILKTKDGINLYSEDTCFAVSVVDNRIEEINVKEVKNTKDFLYFSTKEAAEQYIKSTLKANTGKFEVGDKVKVVRKAESREGDWDNSWTPSMNESIGKVLTIMKNCKLYGYKLNDFHGLDYPEFVLELVEKPLVKVDDKFIYPSDLKVGEVYWSNNSFYKKGFIWRFKSINQDKTYFNANVLTLNDHQFEQTGLNNSAWENLRPATTEEIQWLEKCEKANKYVEQYDYDFQKGELYYIESTQGFSYFAIFDYLETYITTNFISSKFYSSYRNMLKVTQHAICNVKDISEVRLATEEEKEFFKHLDKEVISFEQWKKIEWYKTLTGFTKRNNILDKDIIVYPEKKDIIIVYKSKTKTSKKATTKEVKEIEQFLKELCQ